MIFKNYEKELNKVCYFISADLGWHACT